MNTQELTSRITSEISQDMPSLTAAQEYTDAQIQAATYIYINPDDQRWELGFEDTEALEFDTLSDYLDGSLDYSDIPLLPIYIW